MSIMDQPIPARVRDRLLGMAERNPFEFALSAWWVACGLLLVFSAATDFDPSPSFLVLPDWIALVMGAPLLAGGVGVILAFTLRFENLADRWRLERFSLSMVAAGMLGYAAAVLFYRPESLLPAGMAVSTAVACALRTWASWRQERAIRVLRGERVRRCAAHRLWRKVTGGNDV